MINFVIALPAEATPIAQHYRLKKSNRSHPFPLYSTDTMQLVVSGVGKCNSAAATAWLAGITSESRQHGSIWINIGIAGHGECDIGTAICASRVKDAATEQNWYPTLIDNPLLKQTVETVDTPSHDYPNNNAFDMEASGFYASALRISTSEFAQCFKVISDNKGNSTSEITPELTRQLIGDNLVKFDAQTQQLQSLSSDIEIIDSAKIEAEFHHRWKFSATQKNQLQRLLHRQFAMTGNFEQARMLLSMESPTSVSTTELLSRFDSLVNQPAIADQ